MEDFKVGRKYIVGGILTGIALCIIMHWILTTGVFIIDRIF